LTLLRLLDEVVRQAGDRCEYYRLSQASQEATFHIDQVVPLDLNK
jgi:hypothetical protein